MAAATGNTGWAQLRQQARSLETQVRYSSAQNVIQASLTSGLHRQRRYSTPTLSSRRYPTSRQSPQKKKGPQKRSSKISSKKYAQALVRQTSALTPFAALNAQAALTSSALKQNNLALLREKLAEHKRDLVRLRKTISEARDRAHLLTNVRSDIDEYRANNPENAEAEYMLAERSRIDNSHNMADSVLSQAYAVQDSFNIQRETLASINRRITMAASQVPGLNSLISRISAKKRRDGIIMGAFIAFCFLMFWWFL
ncbi:vesicle transport V-SNARE protein [Colletotrichum paranaense]|uniref:Vesicle transport V-SNARE protein n=1 Tax=Colletotrichum paranaense TaxID=1914294 RepID=A0ABQ9T0B9_9PEZI|nr:vesicle transport V-SNARE protein [Colletotrichum paranaense]KAK1545218.1 vesicle transport V-SNARE protein [Colletotrichum paranaense]